MTQRSSGPTVWDKAKWHSEQGDAGGHIFFILNWLKAKKLTTLDGDEEALGRMGDDTTLNSDMVTERGKVFLDKYYDNWLDIIDSTPVSRSRKNLDKFLNEFNRRFPPAPDPDEVAGDSFSSEQNAMYRKLRRKELSGGVEVEHIVGVTLKCDANLIPVLKRLSAEFKWKEGKKALRSHSVPMGSWVKVCCSYLKDGNSGLVSIVQRSSDEVEREIAVSVIGELKPVDSKRILIDLIKWHTRLQAKQRKLALEIVRVINSLFSFHSEVKLNERDCQIIRNYVHKFLANAKTKDERGTAYWALSRVGNEESITIIRSAPRLGFPWEGTEEDAIKLIRKCISKH